MPLMETGGTASPHRGEEEEEEEEVRGGEDITDDDFLEQAFSRDIVQAERETTDAYIESITERLSKRVILTDRDHTDLTRDLLETLQGYVTVECNAQVIDDTASNLYYEVITNATKDYQDLIDMSVLLLNAPKGPGGIQFHTLEQNQAARQKQLENFLSKYQQKFPDYSFESVTGVVKNYEDIMEHIVSFFQHLGQRSKMAVIVYNGHGTQRGTLSLESEPTSITNTQFLDDIQGIWEMHRGKDYRQRNRPVSLPMRVKVILAHCYGHVHERSAPSEEIQAVSLSTEANPITTSKIWWSTRSIAPHTRVVDSVHEELEIYTTTRDVRASELDVITRDIQHRQQTADSLQISGFDAAVMSPVTQSVPLSGVPLPENRTVDSMDGSKPVPESGGYRVSPDATATDADFVNDVKRSADARQNIIKDKRRLTTKYRTLPPLRFVRTLSQVAKRRSGYRTIETQRLARLSLPPNLTLVDKDKAFAVAPTTGRAEREIVIQNTLQQTELTTAVTVTPKPCVVMRGRTVDSDHQNTTPGCNHRFCQSHYNTVYVAENEVQEATPVGSGTHSGVAPVDVTPADVTPASPAVSVEGSSYTSRLRLVQDDNMSITSSCIFCCYKCRKSRNMQE